jgi:hypothetical protein
MYRWTGVLLTCAWILWGITGLVMMPKGGYETRQACQAELDKEQQRTQTQVMNISWACLPDTVDPRWR